MLRWIRYLRIETPDLDRITVVPVAGSDAALSLIGGKSLASLEETARRVELAIYRVVGSLAPPLTEDLEEDPVDLDLGLDSEDIMLSTGPIGCGKSLIVRHAAEHFDTNRYQLIYLRGDLKNVSELFKLVLRGMKVDPPHTILKAKPLFFSTVSEAARKPVVILDDAQDASPEALLAIKAMTNFDSDSLNRITFILVGQPELTTILGYSHFDSLRARIRLAHQLTAMSLEETCAYIDHGLAIVQQCHLQIVEER